MSDQKTEEHWYQEYPNLTCTEIDPSHYIGEVDARDEWGGGKNPEGIFLHINSYKKLKEKSSLFLYGRRGTGKTALIRMLDHEINDKRLSRYQYSKLLDNEKSYADLSIQVHGSPMINLDYKDLTIKLKENWQWLIEVSAMQVIIENKNSRISDYPLLDNAYKYLKFENLLPDCDDANCRNKISPFSRMAKIIAEEIRKIDNIHLKFGSALYAITERFLSKDFEKARASLYKYLKETNSTCLVMIDSIEPYEATNKIFKVLTASLMEVALDLYSENSKNGVLCKIAFPSEMEPHLKPLNVGKTEARSLYIRWSYDALICLIALRFMKLVNHNGPRKNYDKLEISKEAKDFLYKYLPKNMPTKSTNKFDTMANILRHTQKKPRQAISLMNTILTLAVKRKETFDAISTETIHDGIHCRLDVLVKSVTQMYDNIYPSCYSIITSALLNKENHMNMPELDKCLRSSLNIRRKEYNNYEIKRMLFEVGVIGVQQRTGHMPDGKDVYEVSYEYQVKNILPFNERSHLVIHPMFYTVLQTRVDKRVLMYPVPGEDLEIKILLDQGINLG